MGKYDHLTREELIALLEKNEQEETVKLQDRLDGERRIAEALVLMLKNYNGNYEEDIMRIVLERYKADRAFIFKFNWEDNTNSNILEVYSEGTTPEIHNLQNLPNEALSDCLESFKNNIPLIVNNVNQMEETNYQGSRRIKEIFQTLNLKSAILFPMHIFGQLWGYVGMETVRNYRNWDDDDVEWLRSFTNVLSISVSQQQMRTQASNNEKRFSELFKNMPIGYVRHRLICDDNNVPIDYEYLEVNPAFKRLTGLSSKECIGKRASEIFGNLKITPLSLYQKVAQEGLQTEIDYHTLSQDRCYHSILYSPRQDEFISLFYDITEQIRTTKQIQQNEKKTRTILENLPISVVSFDDEGRFQECNEQASRTFKKLQKPENNGDLDLKPEQKKKLDSQKVLSLEFTFNIEQQRIIKIDHQIFPRDAVFLTTKTIKYTNDKGECLGYLFIAVDNTSIKQANLKLTTTQKELTEHLVRQSLILETGQIYPWYMNIETGELNINEEFYKVFGQTKNSYHNFTIPEIAKYVHPEDLDIFRKEFNELEKGLTPKIKLELRINFFQQGFLWCEINAAAQTRGKSNNITKLLGFLIIIQQRKDNEYQLIEAIKKAKESDNLKSAFLANVSHEIRTPLNAIVGFSELIAQTEDEKEKEYFLDIVKMNNNLLLNLINDILDLSKIESGRIDLKKEVVNVRELCKEICQVHQLRAQTGVKIIFETENQPLTILTDSNRLTQLYSNLINNAVKYTSQGSITIGYERKEKVVEFYVRDTGKGIPQEQQNLIFNRFEKLGSNVQGFGLGLSICKSIIEKMQGTITLFSQEGKGSEFRFSIPYQEVR